MLSLTRSVLFRFFIQDYYEIDLKLLKTAGEFSAESRLSQEDLEQLYGFGYYQFASGLWEPARVIFHALTIQVPTNASYWRALGLANYELKNYAEAMRALEEAIKLDPGSIICRVYHVELELITGKTQEGFNALKALVEENRASVSKDAFLARAKILLKRNTPKE